MFCLSSPVLIPSTLVLMIDTMISFAQLGGRRIYDPLTGQQNQELEELARKAQAEAVTLLARHGRGEYLPNDHRTTARLRVQDLLSQPLAHAGSSTSHQRQHGTPRSLSHDPRGPFMPPQDNIQNSNSVETWRQHAYAHEADATLPSFLNEDLIPPPRPQPSGSSNLALDDVSYVAEEPVKRKPGRPKGSTTGLSAHRRLSRFSPHGLSRSSSLSRGSEPIVSLAERPENFAEVTAANTDLDFQGYIAPSISITRSHSPVHSHPPVYNPPQAHQLGDVWRGDNPANSAAEGQPPFIKQTYPQDNHQSKSEGHLSSSQLAQTQPRRLNQITRLVAILIDDRRFEEGDPQIAEFRLGLHVADAADGYWCNTRDVCEQLQSSPSRIDGMDPMSHCRIILIRSFASSCRAS